MLASQLLSNATNKYLSLSHQHFKKFRKKWWYLLLINKCLLCTDNDYTQKYWCIDVYHKRKMFFNHEFIPDFIYFQQREFLVRNNTHADRNIRPFILSFNYCNTTQHVTIRRNKDGYFLGDDKEMVRFNTYYLSYYVSDIEGPFVHS